MAQTSGFFNAQLDGGGNFDRVYLAEQFAEYFSNFIGNGVFEGQLDQLQVVASSGLTIGVRTGKAFCKGFWYKNSEVVFMTVDTPDGLLNRIDNVVVRFDFSQRIASLAVVKGIPSSTPIAPSLTRTGSVYELKLAQIYVGASASAITQSNITDTRSDYNVCGWVVGLIDQVDTTTLFSQWEAAYQESIDEMDAWGVGQKAAFDAWMSTLTEELNVDGYMVCHEFRLMMEDDEWPTNLSFNISSAYYDWANEFDLTKKFDKIEVFVNGLLLPDYDDYFSNFKHIYGDDVPDFPSSSKHYVVKVVQNVAGSFSLAYGYVNNALNNYFAAVTFEDLRNNEVIIRLSQFRKGVHS